MVDEVANVALGFDARGAQQGAALFAAAGEAIIGEAKKVEGALQGVGASAAKMADEFTPATTRISAETKAMGRSFEALAGRIDPLGREVRRAQADFDALAKVAAGTGVRVAEAAALMGAAQDRLTAAMQAQANAARSADPALRDFGGEMSRAAAAADALKSSIYPVSAAYLAQAASLSKLDSLAKLGLITDQQRAVAADQETAAFRRKIAELDGTAQAERNAAQAAKEAATAEAQLAAQTKAFIAVADPAAAATAHLAEQRAVADKLLAAGRITTEQHTAGLKAFAAQTDSVTRSGAAASNMMRQFGIQSFDVFSSLSAGAPVMTTFVQQGAQIAQVAAAQGGALAALGQVARSVFAAATSPIGLAITAAAALAGGIALVGMRALDAAEETRTIGTAISAVGRQAELSAGQLQRYVTTLGQAGVSRSDAAGIVATLARNPGLSAADIGRVSGVVPDAAVALGVDPSAAAKDIGAAAAGSLSAITKLDDALNFLTRDQRTQIRTMLEHGDQIGAAGIAMDELRRHVDGVRENSLGPFEKAWEGITRAYNAALDNMSARKVPSFSELEALAQPFANPGALSTTLPAGATPRQAEDASLAAGTKERERQGKVVDELTKKLDEESRVISAGLPGRAAVRAAIEAGRIAAEKGLGVDEKRALTTAMVANANRQAADGAIQEASATGRQIAAAVMLTGATLEGRSAAILAAAAAEAHDKAATQAGVSENAWARAIANRAAAQGAQKGAETAAGLAEQEAGLQRLIDAQGAEGRQAAELANKIADATRELDALEAVTTRVDVLEAIMKARDAIEDRLRSQDRLNIALRERNALESGQFQIEAVQKEISLIGQAAEVREREIAAFRTLQELRRTDKADIDNLTEAQKALIEQSRQYADLQGSLRHQQNSLTAVTDTLGTAFDRLGQAMVDAFVSGQGRAVNFGNVMRGIVASLLSDFAKLAVINPVLNSLFPSSRGPRDTLSAAFGGGGGSSLIGQASNVSSLAGLSDALGITSIKDTLAGWGSSLGITGNGGLLGALNSLLSTTLFQSGGSAASILAAGGGAYTPATIAAIQASAAGSVSLGGALGGFGAGFGIGSFGGGLLQGALGKTGPAPTIGAGVGAAGGALIGSIVPGIGTVLGGILGGLLGGGGGGLIGPQKASSFSSTGLGISATGGIDIGKTVSQIADTTAELAQLQQQVGQINQLLAASGAIITSLGGVTQIGQNTPGGFKDPSKAAGIDDAFSGLRFSAPGNDTLNRAISNRSFGAVADLANVIQEVTTFVDQTVPALRKLGEPAKFGLGTLGTALGELQAQFDAARATAERLGYAVNDLAVANDNARKAVYDAAYKQLANTDNDLRVRLATAAATLSGSTADALAASLQAFDLAATREQEQFRATLLGTFGDAYEATEGFANQIALLQAAEGTERLAIIKSANERIVAEEKQAAEAALSQYKTEADITFAIKTRLQRLQGNTVETDLSEMYRNQWSEYWATYHALTPQGGRVNEQVGAVLANLSASHNLEWQAYLDKLAAQWRDMGVGLQQREAAVANDNLPKQLQLFDAKAAIEVEEFRKQIIALGASGAKVTDTLARLVAVQGAERQAIVDQAAAIERQRQEQQATQLRSTQVGIEARVIQAGGNSLPGQLRLFDMQAVDEVEALRKSLTDLGLTAAQVSGTVASLTAAQAKERAALVWQGNQARLDNNVTLLAREVAAKGNKLSDQLYLFDVQAGIEVSRTRDELIRLGFSTEEITRKMTKLVQIQGLERQTLEMQAADLEASNRNAAAGTASGVIRSITEYARGLQFGAESPLSATAQLDAATRQFDAVRGAAAAGDFASAQQLTGFAETLRSAARNVFGSGIGYVDIIKKITDALEPISTMAPEKLITSVMTTELRSQTQTLSGDIQDLRSVLIQVRDSIRAGSGAPPASRAA